MFLSYLVTFQVLLVSAAVAPGGATSVTNPIVGRDIRQKYTGNESLRMFEHTRAT